MVAEGFMGEKAGGGEVCSMVAAVVPVRIPGQPSESNKEEQVEDVCISYLLP